MPIEIVKNPLEALSLTPTPEEVKLAIVFLSGNMDLGKDYYQTLYCESSFRYDAIGPSGEIGVAQYFKSTWKYFNELRGTKLDIYNTQPQLEMTTWAWKNGLKFHWVCWSKLHGI